MMHEERIEKLKRKCEIDDAAVRSALSKLDEARQVVDTLQQLRLIHQRELSQAMSAALREHGVQE